MARRITDVTLGVRGYDKELARELNLQRKGLDNAWLYSKVGEGWLSQEAFLQIQIMRDMCEHVYPDLWDIQLKIHKTPVLVKYEQEENNFDIDPDSIVQHIGAYYGSEPVAEDEVPDVTRYYLDNFRDEEYNTIYYGHQMIESLAEIQEWTEIDPPVISLSFRIVVKWPEFILTNSNGRNQKIRDIYFSLTYGPENYLRDILPYAAHNSRRIVVQGPQIPLGTDTGITYRISPYVLHSGLQSCRTTVTAIEYANQFLHSHSHRRSQLKTDVTTVSEFGSYVAFTEWGGCCLGSGEIIQTFAMLRNEFNPGLFTLLLHQMDAYAIWESIEGTPYISIDTFLGEGAKRYTTPPEVADNNKDLYFAKLKRYLKSRFDTELDWMISDQGQLSIVENQKLSDLCLYKGEDIYTSYPLNCLFKKTQDGYYSEVKRRRTSTTVATLLPQDHRLRADIKVIFRGEEIPLNVIEDDIVEETEEGMEEYVLNPSIIKHVKQKIEDHANYKKVRDYTTTRASQRHY